MSRAAVGAALTLAVLWLTGCSAIPPGGDPASDARVQSLARAARPRLGRLCVAPVVSLTLAVDEAAKGWRPSESEALAEGTVRRDLAQGLAASGSWDGIRLGEAATAAEAWAQRDDWVLSVEVSELRTRFDGRNGWWIPNVVNFLLNTPFSWWVATEEYSLTLEATVTLTSGDTGSLVGRSVLPIQAHGTFDEFDRGWQILGPIVSSLDAEGWRGIATKLFPEARRELAVEVSLEADRLLRAARETTAFDEAQRKTLVLAVGITSYEDPHALPPVPYAREDAGRVAATFERLGVLGHHVVTLADGAATVAAVTSRIAEHLGRAHEGDSVVLWFSGTGTRLADGRPAILLHDSPPGAGLPVDELAKALAAVPGDKLLVLDTSFAGAGRSIVGGSRPNGSAADAELLEASGVSAVLAGRPGDTALAPDHLKSGLLTFHALRALERLGHDSRRVALREVFAALQPAVAEDAEFLGAEEVPVLVERGQRFAFLFARGGPP